MNDRFMFLSTIISDEKKQIAIIKFYPIKLTGRLNRVFQQ